MSVYLFSYALGLSFGLLFSNAAAAINGNNVIKIVTVYKCKVYFLFNQQQPHMCRGMARAVNHPPRSWHLMKGVWLNDFLRVKNMFTLFKEVIECRLQITTKEMD